MNNGQASAWWARGGAAGGVTAWVAAVVLLWEPTIHAWGGSRSPGASVDDAAAALAGAAALALLAWIGIGTATTAGAHVLPPGRLASLARRWSERISPAVARRSVTAVVTAALALGPTAAQADAAPTAQVAAATDARRAVEPVDDRPIVVEPVRYRRAAAEPGTAHLPLSGRPVMGSPATDHTAGVRGATADRGLDPGWAPTVPELPVVRPRRPDHRSVPVLDPAWGAPERRRPSLQPQKVVVHRGDTLWQIAARQLGPGATDAAIAHAWHLWYATNRRVIGPDPDRLLPGQELFRPRQLSGGLP